MPDRRLQMHNQCNRSRSYSTRRIRRRLVGTDQPSSIMQKLQSRTQRQAKNEEFARMVNPFFPSKTFSTPTKALFFHIQSETDDRSSHDKNDEIPTKTHKISRYRSVLGWFFQFFGYPKYDPGVENSRPSRACRYSARRDSAALGAPGGRPSGKCEFMERVSSGGVCFARRSRG